MQPSGLIDQPLSCCLDILATCEVLWLVFVQYGQIVDSLYQLQPGHECLRESWQVLCPSNGRMTCHPIGLPCTHAFLALVSLAIMQLVGLTIGSNSPTCIDTTYLQLFQQFYACVKIVHVHTAAGSWMFERIITGFVSIQWQNDMSSNWATLYSCLASFSFFGNNSVGRPLWLALTIPHA